jgi:hypothetical protein
MAPPSLLKTALKWRLVQWCMTQCMAIGCRHGGFRGWKTLEFPTALSQVSTRPPPPTPPPPPPKRKQTKPRYLYVPLLLLNFSTLHELGPPPSYAQKP